jgi:hypothetical protein
MYTVGTVITSPPPHMSNTIADQLADRIIDMTDAELQAHLDMIPLNDGKDTTVGQVLSVADLGREHAERRVYYAIAFAVITELPKQPVILPSHQNVYAVESHDESCYDDACLYKDCEGTGKAAINGECPDCGAHIDSMTD